MITLYLKTGCPYCAKVLDVVEKYSIPYEGKNIADPAVAAELTEIGGKRQVPYLDDDNMTPYLVDDDVEMYESNAIVAYLENKYGHTHDTEKSGADIRLHREDDSDVCEGCQ